MKRLMSTAVLILTMAAPAWADVTIRQAAAGKGLGKSGKSTEVTYLKGSKMRTETISGSRTQVTILDLDAQKMYSFDLKKKEADVWDMQAMAADMNKAVDTSAMTASVKPNGQTKEIAGKTASGYDLEIEVPMTMGGPGGPAMTMKMTGPIWVVKDAPGTRDYASFYKTAAEKGAFFGDPDAAKGSPGQARAMAEMYRQLAQIGGFPYGQEIQISVGGGGPMAGLMSKLGGMSMSTFVESVETGTLADDLFAPPADYKLKTRK